MPRLELLCPDKALSSQHLNPFRRRRSCGRHARPSRCSSERGAPWAQPMVRPGPASSSPTAAPAGRAVPHTIRPPRRVATEQALARAPQAGPHAVGATGLGRGSGLISSCADPGTDSGTDSDMKDSDSSRVRVRAAAGMPASTAAGATSETHSLTHSLTHTHTPGTPCDTNTHTHPRFDRIFTG